MVTRFIILAGSPETFDAIIAQYNAALVRNAWGYLALTADDESTCYVMVAEGDPGFLLFSVKNQGYGTIAKQLSQDEWTAIEAAHIGATADV